ncbi:MAG: LysR family transcriptional regulator [Pseudomonadota bacterium]
MNLRDLIYMLAVAKHGQFSKAATVCNVSQPALSNQIKKLEKELGGEIFHRHATQARLTELGTRILPVAQRIVADADEIRDVAASFQDPTEEPMRIGIIPTLAPFLTGYLADLFEGLYPDMRVTIIEALSDELCHLIFDREIDIGITPQDGHHPPLMFSPIWREPLLFAAREGHPLTNRAVMRPQNIPVDQFTRIGYPMGFAIEDTLPKPGPGILVGGRLDVSALRFETICRHVCHSTDCTVVTGLAAEQLTKDGWPLSFVPLHGNGAYRPIGLLSRPGFPRQSVLDDLCRYAISKPPMGMEQIKA